MPSKNKNYPNILTKLFVLILLFFFTFNLNAEDISDFEIEGMSIGDSLLDFISEQEIIKEQIG